MTSPVHSPLLGRPESPDGRWVTDIGVRAIPYLADHRVQGTVVLPGSVYVELALAAAAARLPSIVEDMRFERMFLVPTEGTRPLHTAVTTTADGRLMVTATGDTGIRHATTRIGNGSSTLPPPTAAETRTSFDDELPGESLYARLRATGNDYGPTFRGIERYWTADGRAVGVLRVADSVAGEIGDYVLHPVILDAATHMLAAAAGVGECTFVLVGCDRLVLRRPPGRTGRVFAQLRSESDSEDLVGDVALLDGAGQVVFDLAGARLRLLPTPRRPREPPATIAVASTFTAEPIRDPLAFWFDHMGIPASIKFAGYQQVFQELLDPAGLLSSNHHGANVLLVRPQDWLRAGVHPQYTVDEGILDTVFAGVNRFRLPDIGEIAHLVPYETEYLYREIFTRRTYLRYDIKLRDGACVFDVGANIGLFTLFAHHNCVDPTVYAFEPNPLTFDILRRNTAAHCPSTRIFDHGLSDADGERPFTNYPRSPAFSGFAADPARDRAAVTAIAANVLRPHLANRPESASELAALVGRLTRDRLDAEVLLRPTRTLSSVLSEHAVDRIDLLKIDAEGSEMAVLAGVEERHWPLIGQVVIEVHDPATVDRIRELLWRQGFRVSIDDTDDTDDTDDFLRGTAFATVFACRDGERESEEPAGDLDRTVDDLVHSVASAGRVARVPYLVAVCPPAAAARGDPRLRSELDRAERRLIEGLSDQSGVVLITAEEILGTYHVPNPDDSRTDQLGHIPYGPRFFTALGTMIARKYSAYGRPPVKALALDCDQTLWAGVCGEDGPGGIRIDAPRRAVQEFAVEQYDVGVLLCLCSRNNENDVLAVFRHRPTMPLRLDHIVARRVNWRSKSLNLAALADELGLGREAFALIDDDPVECAEVRANQPTALALCLPQDPAEIPAFLGHVWAFDRVRVTEDDRRRPARYRAEQHRRSLLNGSLTVESFLAELHLRVRIDDGRNADLPRVAQLTQRTTQFTVTAVRRTEAWLRERLTGGLECFVVRVDDRFGDYGVVGAVLYETRHDALWVDTFVLSCRALGRGVEHRMLAELGELARQRGLDWVKVPFVRTERNEPAHRFFAEVAGESGETASVFTLAAPIAAAATFRSATRPAPTPASGRPEAPVRLPSSWYQHVADELRDLDDIVAAVEQAGRRPRPELPTIFVRPGDDVERTLVGLWRRVLGVHDVGIDDNFFELGGTSLLGVRLMAELGALTGAELQQVDLFERPTIRTMAAALRAGADDAVPVGASGQRRGSRRRAVQAKRHQMRKRSDDD